MTIEDRMWLTRQEAALYMAVSLDKIDRLREEGSITTYRASGTSRSVRLKKTELDDLMVPETPAGEIVTRSA